MQEELGSGRVSIIFDYLKSWNELKQYTNNKKNAPKIPVQFDVKSKEIEQIMKKVKFTDKEEKAITSYTAIIKRQIRLWKEIDAFTEKIASNHLKSELRVKNTLKYTQQLSQIQKDMIDSKKAEAGLQKTIANRAKNTVDREKTALAVARERLALSRGSGQSVVGGDVNSAAGLYQLNFLATQMESISSSMFKILGNAMSLQREIERSLTITNSVAKGNRQTFLELYNTVIQVGRDAPIALESIANAMYGLASAGLRTTEIMEAMPNATRLAVGVGEDLNTVLTTLISTVNGFDESFSKSNYILDIFAKAVANSQATVEKLNVSFSRVASFSEEAGVSIRETTTFLALLYDRGLSASRAGTVLTNVMQALATFSDKSAKALERNGLKVRDVDLKYNTFKESMVTLAEANLSASDSYQIFGKRGKQIVSIMEQMRREQERLLESDNSINRIEAMNSAYDNLQKKILEAGGVNQFFNATTETTDYVLNQLKNSLKELNLIMAESTKDAFRAIAKSLSSVINSFNDFIKSSDYAKTIVGEFVVVLGGTGLFLAIGAVALKIKYLTGMILGMARSVGILSGSVMSLRAVAFSITGVVGAMMALGGVISAVSVHNDRLRLGSESATKALKELSDITQKLADNMEFGNDALLSSIDLTEEQRLAVGRLEGKFGDQIKTLGDLREAQEKLNKSKKESNEIDDVSATMAEIESTKREIKAMESLISNTEKRIKGAQKKESSILVKYGFSNIGELSKYAEDIYARKDELKQAARSRQPMTDLYGKEINARQVMGIYSDIENIRSISGEASSVSLKKLISEYQASLKKSELDLVSLRKSLNKPKLKDSGEEDVELTPIARDEIISMIADDVNSWVESVKEDLTRKVALKEITEDGANLGKALEDGKNIALENIVNSVIKTIESKSKIDVSASDLDPKKLMEEAIVALYKKTSTISESKKEYKSAITSKDLDYINEYANKLELIGKTGLALLETKMKQKKIELESVRNSETQLKLSKEEYENKKKTGKESPVGDIEFETAEEEKSYEIAKKNYELAIETDEKRLKLELDIAEIQSEIQAGQKEYTSSIYEQNSKIKEHLDNLKAINLTKIQQLELEKSIARASIEGEGRVKSTLDRQQKALSAFLFSGMQTGSTKIEEGIPTFSSDKDKKTYESMLKSIKSTEDEYEKILQYKIRIKDIEKEQTEYDRTRMDVTMEIYSIGLSENALYNTRITYLESQLDATDDLLEREKIRLQIITEQQKRQVEMAQFATSMITGAISGDIKFSGDQAIAKGMENLFTGKGGKAASSSMLALGIIQNMTDQIQAQRIQSLQYEQQSLEIRKQLATTDQEMADIKEEELALEEAMVDAQYEQATNFVGTTGVAGSTLGGAASGAMAGASFGIQGAIVGAVMGGVSGLLGGMSAKTQADNQKRMLESQYAMQQYLEQIQENTRQSNDYLNQFVSISAKAGIDTAKKYALQDVMNTYGDIGGAGTSTWEESYKEWVWKGLSSGMKTKHRTVTESATVGLADLGVDKSDITAIDDLVSLRNKLEGKINETSKQVGELSGEAKAEQEALLEAYENMLVTVDDIISTEETLAPKIYQSYFGATLNAIEDSTGKITDYVTDWVDFTASLMNKSFEESINGFEKSASIATTTLMDGILNSYIQNSSDIASISNKIAEAYERTSENLLAGNDIKDNIKEIISLVATQRVEQEKVNQVSKDFLSTYLAEGGDIVDVIDRMSKSTKSMYDTLKDSLANGDMASTYSNIYNSYITNTLQPMMESTINTSSAMRKLLSDSIEEGMSVEVADKMASVADLMSMSAEEMKGNYSSLSEVLGLSSDAIDEMIRLKEIEEDLSDRAEAASLWNQNYSGFKDATKSGILAGIEASGEVSRDYIEEAIASSVKSATMEKIMTSIFDNPAMDSAISNLTSGIGSMTAKDLTSAVEGLASTTGSVLEEYSPIIESLYDIFDKFTGTSNKPITFFDELNLGKIENVMDGIPTLQSQIKNINPEILTSEERVLRVIVQSEGDLSDYKDLVDKRLEGLDFVEVIY